MKYRLRTLQLLPGKDRPSYAGAVIDVMEGLDGQLAVQHGGRVIPSQETPQCPNILRSFNHRTVHTVVFPLIGNGVDIWKGKFAELELKAPTAVTAPEDLTEQRRLLPQIPPHLSQSMKPKLMSTS